MKDINNTYFWLDLSTKSGSSSTSGNLTVGNVITTGVYTNGYYYANGSAYSPDVTSINKKAAAFAYIFG
jgi:hypothetical protein